MKKISILIIVVIILVVGILAVNTVPKKAEVSTNFVYEVIEDRSVLDQLEIEDKKNRGYEVIQQDDYYYLVIKHGEESVCYSKLEVNKVEVNGNNIEVHVQLPKGEGMGDAFSYPKAIIKLNQKPGKVKIRYN